MRRRIIVPPSLAKETDEEEKCDYTAARFGFGDISRLSQRRNSRIVRGLPDRRYRSRYWRVALFFEVKWKGRKLTKEQAEFIENELDAGAFATCGDDTDLNAIMQLIHSVDRNAPNRSRQIAELCRSIFNGWKEKGLAEN